MERWNSLPSILRQIILGSTLFVVGAAVSFAYSYRPLHGALVWKVESLETRLDARNREYVDLKDELARISSEESKLVDPETLAQIERELAKTKKALSAAERESKSVDKKRRDAVANADRWRKRYESLRDQEAAIPAAKAPTPNAVQQPAAAPSQGSPAGAVPATIPADSPAGFEMAPRLPVDRDTQPFR